MAAAAAAKCRTVRGQLVDQVQVAPGVNGCLSSIFCVDGRATGALRGDFRATVTSLRPSVDTPTTSVVFLTTDLVLNDRHGQLTIKEAIAYATADGQFADLATVVGGTGRWQGATGRLVISGQLNFVDPSDVTYAGQICRPAAHR